MQTNRHTHKPYTHLPPSLSHTHTICPLIHTQTYTHKPHHTHNLPLTHTHTHTHSVCMYRSAQKCVYVWRKRFLMQEWHHSVITLVDKHCHHWVVRFSTSLTTLWPCCFGFRVWRVVSLLPIWFFFVCLFIHFIILLLQYLPMCIHSYLNYNYFQCSKTKRNS